MRYISRTCPILPQSQLKHNSRDTVPLKWIFLRNSKCNCRHRLIIDLWKSLTIWKNFPFPLVIICVCYYVDDKYTNIIIIKNRLPLLCSNTGARAATPGSRPTRAGSASPWRTRPAASGSPSPTPMIQAPTHLVVLECILPDTHKLIINVDRPTKHSLPLTKMTNLSSEWKVGWFEDYCIENL